jgi:hypothetical protein
MLLASRLIASPDSAAQVYLPKQKVSKAVF